MIKLIACDIDGTLVGKQRIITPYTEQKIKEAIDMGIHFAIASGRAYDDITPISKKHGLKCQIIAGNGSEYYDEDGNLMLGFYLNHETTKLLIHLFNNQQLPYMLYTSIGTFTTLDVDVVKDMFIRRKTAQGGGVYEDNYRHMQENYVPFATLKHIDDVEEILKDDVKVIKVEGFHEYEGPILEMKQAISDIDGIAYLSSFYNNVEITNIDAQKGYSLRRACQYMGIQEDEVMICGDGLNDLSMFEIFKKHSVAVDNAVPELKELAKYVVPSVDEDGVGVAISQYVTKG